ncbi:hypothetical protein Tco_1448954 [Tanacetum coccineum]
MILCCKVKSAKAKMACSKCVFLHTMGREIEQDEEPTRGTLWLKGRVNKDGEYQDDDIRLVGDKLKETEDKIKEGTLQVDQGTDAMTLVLGKEKGGYARGVGSGVTYKRYFDLPRSKQAADERILLLESQLDAARREREEKELLIKSMSSKMSQTEGMVTKLKNQLAAQGGQLQSTPTQLTPLDVSPVEIHPINSSADEEGRTTVLGCDQNDASIRKEMQKKETVKSMGAKRTTRSIRKDSSSQDSQFKENVSVLRQAIQCRLWHLKKKTIIAEGTVYKSDGKIMLHNKALLKDCYKVSIDKSLVDAAFIADVGSNGCTTVLDAVGGFVAWPKNQVVFYPKATPPSTIQMITVENKTAPKVPTKRKNFYVSSDAMQKEANKKRIMSTRSTSSNLFSPLRDPESLIRRRNLGEPSSLYDFKETMSIPHNNSGPPPAGPPPQNNNGLPPTVRPNGLAPDLQSMEELCQPSINGRGGPIAPIPIQAMDFGLRHHMIQQV